MSRIFKLRPVVNKRNGQINLSLRKKDLPKKLSDFIKKDSKVKGFLKLKFEGFE